MNNCIKCGCETDNMVSFNGFEGFAHTCKVEFMCTDCSTPEYIGDNRFLKLDKDVFIYNLGGGSFTKIRSRATFEYYVNQHKIDFLNGTDLEGE